MRTFRIALALALCLTMQGCNLGLNALRSGNAPGALNTRGDTRIIASTCMAGFDTCESVVQVEEATALEAWAVTSKERQNGPYGIPAGEVPITLYIVGFKADCDRAEARLLVHRGRCLEPLGLWLGLEQHHAHPLLQPAARNILDAGISQG